MSSQPVPVRLRNIRKHNRRSTNGGDALKPHLNSTVDDTLSIHIIHDVRLNVIAARISHWQMFKVEGGNPRENYPLAAENA